MNLAALPENPKFSKNEVRVQHRIELIEIIEHVMKQKTNKEWNMILNGAKFPYGPVNELKEVFADSQVLHNDITHQNPSILKYPPRKSVC